MATTTENIYTGDGSTQLFPFTFPYIEESDVVVSVDGVVLTIITEYLFSNATTIGINTAPADGAEVKIKRLTSSDNLKATFFPGSAIRARDLNDNFTQNLYVTQESVFNADEAIDAAEQASAAAAAAQAAAAQAQADATQAAQDAAEAAAGIEGANDAAADAQQSANEAKEDAQAAADDAAEAQQDAADAKAAVDEIIDAIGDGEVLSVNGQSGIVSLGIGDMTDVDTSSAGHVPADGQSLVWNQAMGHWMPADATLVIGSLPTLP